MRHRILFMPQPHSSETADNISASTAALPAAAPPKRSAPIRREIVSFVRRSSRMNTSQRNAVAKYGPQWILEVERGETSTSISPAAEPLDWDNIFGRSGAPLALEIGSGAGDSPVYFAKKNPDWNVVAIEVFLPSIASTLIKINQNELTNIRLIKGDGAGALKYLFAEKSLSEIRIFFPDPWHKKRHHKRRLINSVFAGIAAQKLKSGGNLFLATDWQEYALAMYEVLAGCPEMIFCPDPQLQNEVLLDSSAADFAQQLCNAGRRAERPLTRYEQRGIEAGRKIFNLCYRKDAEGSA